MIGLNVRRLNTWVTSTYSIPKYNHLRSVMRRYCRLTWLFHVFLQSSRAWKGIMVQYHFLNTCMSQEAVVLLLIWKVSHDLYLQDKHECNLIARHILSPCLLIELTSQILSNPSNQVQVIHQILEIVHRSHNSNT